MSCCADQTLFASAPDLKLTPKMLSALANMCSAEKPFEDTILIGDFAFAEICVSDEETKELKDIFNTLRNDDAKSFVGQLVDAANAKAKEARKPALAKVAEAMDAEYRRLVKTFFIRVRCFEVYRNSSGASIGRVIAFPDQFSDEYGNNLDAHTEEGMHLGRVSHAKKSKALFSSTVYLGHGQGAAMAQYCGFLKDEEAIVFDSTPLGEAIVQHAVTRKLPDEVQAAPRKESPRDCNVKHFYLEATAKPMESVQPKVVEIIASVHAANLDGGDEKQAEQAKSYFAKRCTCKVAAVLSAAVATRAEKTGRVPAAAWSDMLNAHMTTIHMAPSPYASA